MPRSGAPSTGQPQPDLSPRPKPKGIRRGGSYFRIAKDWWPDPLDGSFAQRDGGRWNAPGSFPVVYLNATEEVARANVVRTLARVGTSWEDLQEEARPILVDVDVPENEFLDVVTDRGCRDAGLPEIYPLDGRGREVPWRRCRPVGQEAFGAGLAGVACRSAAIPRPPYAEELAWFPHESTQLVPGCRRRFSEWYHGQTD